MGIEHSALVLWRCHELAAERAEHSSKEQEMIVMYYCSSLFKHAEALNNAEVLAKIREHKLVHLVVEHITQHAYTEDFAWEVALGLAALCDNEDFKTEWLRFFETPDGQPDRDSMQAFLS